MMSKILSTAVVVMLALQASGAQATTQASYSISGLQAAVTDLTPADATAAKLVWDNYWSLNTYSTDQLQTGWTTTHYAWGDYKQAQWGASDSANSYVYQPNTSLATNSNKGFGSQSASLDALLAPTLTGSDTVAAGQYGSSESTFNRSFTLGAGSQVTFSVLVSGDVAGSAATWTRPPGDSNSYDSHSSAYFYGYLNVYSYGGGVNENQSASTGLNGYNYFYTYNQAAFAGSMDEKLITLTVTNDTAFDKDYSLNVFGYVYAQEALAPVPEPESYALLGLGLAVIGGVKRRQIKT